MTKLDEMLAYMDEDDAASVRAVLDWYARPVEGPPPPPGTETQRQLHRGIALGIAWSNNQMKRMA